jgi:hypothetical protein
VFEKSFCCERSTGDSGKMVLKKYFASVIFGTVNVEEISGFR